MSPPSGTGGGPSGEGAALVADVERYVAEWRKLLAQGVRAGASVDAQVRVSSGLQDRARRASFGGLAHHLSRIDAIAAVPGGVNADAMVAPLRDVSDVVEQIKHALGEARPPSGPPLGSASGSLGPPRMVTHMPLGGGARTGGQPVVPSKVEISMKATPSPSAPPLLGLSAIGVGRNAGPPQGRPSGQMGQLSPLPLDSPAMPPLGVAPAPGPGQLSPLPLDMPRDPAVTGPMAMPGQLRQPGGLPPPAAAPLPGPSGFGLPPLDAVQAPYQAGPPFQAPPLQAPPLQAPPPLGMPSSLDGPSGGGGVSQSMRTGAPKLMVRTMFGLRAFGRQKADAAPAAPERPGSILGLRSLSSEPGNAPKRDASMPRMLNNSLPPLPGALREAEGDERPPPSLFGELLKGRGKTGSQKIKARDRDSGPRRIREGGAPPPRRPGARRRVDGGGGSLLWAYIALGVIALGSIITVIVLVVRRNQPVVEVPKADAAKTAPSAAGSAVAVPDKGIKFLTEDEGLKSMLGMIHGKGQESPELRALVDDQAKLLHKMVSTQKCQGTTEACDQWNEAKELLNTNAKQIEKRKVDPNKRLNSRWLAGLTMPDIPIEDDPRVQRAFESITVNPLGRERFVSMLFRCGAHWDLIKTTLQRYELPQAILAVVFTESGCSPKIDSPVGAKGLWQFMPETGRAYHLRIIEEKLDERMSPVKSTEAAIHYLSDLKQKLNSWDLVFASYNLGPYGVLARLRKAGDDVGFWDLVDAEYLPDETANYVPYIQAYALVLANLRKLNFGGTQKMPPDNTADLEVASSTRLTLVARVASTSLSTIQRLNPDILSELVPAVPSQRFVVQVPKDNVWQARDMLAALVAQKDEDDLCVPTSFDWGKQRFTDEMRLACGKKLAAPLPVPVPMQ